MTSERMQSGATAESHDPVREYAAALCDDALTAEQARHLAELLNGSNDARMRFVEYLFLHGELHWGLAATLPSQLGAVRSVRSMGDMSPASCVAAAAPLPMSEGGGAGRVARRRGAGGRRGLRAVVGALLTAAVAVIFAVVLVRSWQSVDVHPAEPSARIVETFGAVWDGDAAPELGQPLDPKQWWTLAGGLAKVETPAGATFIIEGPARWAADGSNHLRLAVGGVSADVPHAARGFCVEIPTARVIDEGTSFGVRVEPDGQSEVHVFVGRVAVVADSTNVSALVLDEGRSVAWLPSQRDRLTQLPVAPSSEDRFARTMPSESSGSVARLRRAMAEHPRLIHLFSFEEVDPTAGLRDAKGYLHLHRIVMSGGDGDGSLRTGVRGRDPTSRGVQFYRASRDGDRVGVGLVSERTFVPPAEMTIELVARFDAQPRAAGGIFSAVATRGSRKQCGFFVAAVDDGRLAHLFDADSPWTIPPGDPFWRPLIGTTGDWHYLCVRLEQEDANTRVSAFAANLTQGERSLRCLVDSVSMNGHAASGPLAVGCGFADDLTHAYPWAGVIDELAIYDVALETEILQRHLDLLWSAPQNAGAP